MPKINRKNLNGACSNTGIEALVIEGSNPSLLAIEWTRKNGYRWLSVPEVYQRSGLDGILAIKQEQSKWRGEAYEDRRYGPNSPLRVEGYTIFNTYFLSQAIVDVEQLSPKVFARMEWLRFYIAHNPGVDASIKQRGDDLAISITKDLADKFSMTDISDIFYFTGAPWRGIAWLQADLTKVDDSIYEKLFGESIAHYADRLRELHLSESSIISCPLPSRDLTAMPVELGTHAGFSLSNYPFWYSADAENQKHRIDRIYVFPVIKNSILQLHR